MKIIKSIDFRHQQLKSQKTGELYSLSDVVSEKIGSNQLFIHQDIIKPNTKSSGAHRHSIIEEVVYVLKGAVTVVSGENKTIVEEDGLILFDPKETQTHYILNHSDQDAETLTFSTKSEFDLVIYEKNKNIHKANEKIENEIRSVAIGKFENSEVENFIQVFKKIQVESGNSIIDFFVQISTDEGSELELGFFTESHIADVTLSKGQVYSYSYSLETVKKTDLIDDDLKWTLTILGEKKFDYNVAKPGLKDDLIRYEKNLNEYLNCAKEEEENSIQQPESTFDQDLRDVPRDIKEWETFLVKLKNRLKAEKHPEKLLSLYEHIGMASRTLNRLSEAEHSLMKAVTLSYSYPSQSRLVQNLIRLAHVYQWKKDFEKSQLLFDQARSIINEKSISKGLQAAYHQHLGKLYFDRCQYGRAQAEFGLALSLRNKINAPKDQIESSALSLKEALNRWQCKFDSGNPLRFKSENINDAFQLMDINPFATVISVSDGKPMVSHLPLTPKKVGEEIILIGHLARANPHWKILTNNQVTAIFHGPHTYVTPVWYAENDVPTWNYSTVHVCGSVELIETYDGIVDCLKELTSHVERHYSSGWDFFIPDDLQGDILPKNIVGFKIKIESINFKNKMSQNRSAADRVGILKGLASRTDDNSRAVLKEMKKLFSSNGEPK